MKLEVVATLFTYFQASSSSIKLKHQAEALQVKVALDLTVIGGIFNFNSCILLAETVHYLDNYACVVST